MTRETTPWLCVATALAAVACFDGTQVISDADAPRRDLLRRAFAQRATDPLRAAELFARAGRGAVLEQARLEAWLGCLESSTASVNQWERFLAADPPPDLAAAAELHMGRALVDRGRAADAVAVLGGVPAARRDAADVLLLEVDDPVVRRRAASRLAVSAPERLRRADRDLERVVLAELSQDAWLERSSRWRAAGSPARAAAELRALRWRGAAERSRRLEIARAEVDAGRPGRALDILPSGRRASGEENLVRASAHRSRAWQRFPGGSARRSFGDCLTAASRAAQALGESAGLHQRADALVVECATEAGSLGQALAAWSRLAAASWRHERRQWLGRRLGVAMAREPGFEPAVGRLLGDLRAHDRCLRYWQAASSGTSSPSARRMLEGLTEGSPPDLYGVWARRDLGLEPAPRLELPPPVDRADPPPSVRLLLDVGAVDDGRREWRRIANLRGVGPAEAITAARLERASGSPNRAIRWLLRAFPSLGTVAMGTVPEDAVREYLPLAWHGELLAAAAEAGVAPWIVAGIARQETVFVARARSHRGAMGVLQLVPGTARMHARALGLGSRPDLYDAEVNLRLGAREVSRLIERFGALEPALAAYNAGETRALRWWRRWPEPRRFTEAVPIPETYNYIRRVTFLAESYRLVYDDEWRAAS